jgi:hypothetical protein
MSRWKSGAALALALVLTAAPAVAGKPLSTGSLSSGWQQDVTYYCSLVNLGKKLVVVTLSIWSTSGQERTSRWVQISSMAGKAVSLPGDTTDSARCQVDGKFSSKDVVLTFGLHDTATNRALVAVTAP